MKLRYSEIKDRIDIDALEEAIGFTPTSSLRGNDTGHCIWPENHTHGDTTGKFAIHRDKLVYNCFVCGGGSLLSLVMELYDLDVDQATEWLAQFTDGAIGTRSNVEWQDYLLEMLGDVEERVDKMPYFNARVLERFEGPIDFFNTRGISDEVILSYNLRYGDTVMKPAPVKNGAKIDEDYYGPAAIFPHYWQSKLVGWQHRWMEWDEERTQVPRWLAKYTNTTDFPKHNTLFNYDNALRARDKIIVCESLPTVLFLASCGVPAVSYFGGDIKDEQLRLLRRFSQGVILAPDNDKVGDKLLSKATPYLERWIPVYHAEKVQLGPKADLGDYVKTKDPYERVREHLQHRVYLSGVEI